jgi:hypothetical protein
MVTKKFFLSLIILISGKESPTAENIDVYLQPLYEELQDLWKGVDASDASPAHERRNFRLWGLLLWTVSDFPAYGLILGQQYSGYHGCPVCGPHVDSRSVKGPKKTRSCSLEVGGGCLRVIHSAGTCSSMDNASIGLPQRDSQVKIFYVSQRNVDSTWQTEEYQRGFTIQCTGWG